MALNERILNFVTERILNFVTPARTIAGAIFIIAGSGTQPENLRLRTPSVPFNSGGANPDLLT